MTNPADYLQFMRRAIAGQVSDKFRQRARVVIAEAAQTHRKTENPGAYFPGKNPYPTVGGTS